ncbi:MAG: pyridoxamine 5'-phosphate oxidase family protein [Candidatus Dormibacteraceae bacterium]
MIQVPRQIETYKVAELVTLTRAGAPVCWPMAPYFGDGKIAFATGYMYPAKAQNAKRNPQVAVLFSDPTASGRDDSDPITLVQGTAVVSDQDLQQNTERYVDRLLASGMAGVGAMLRVPLIRNLMVGYLCRIWIDVAPQRELTWQRDAMPPDELKAVRPAQFTPGPLSTDFTKVRGWLSRYSRPPVLGFVTESGSPAAVRVAAVHEDRLINIRGGVEAADGAPACLTYHRLIGNYQGNDAFLIRGHLRSRSEFVPEKVVGYVGTDDDRGVGTLKVIKLMNSWRGWLKRALASEGKPMVVIRPSRKR